MGNFPQAEPMWPGVLGKFSPKEPVQLRSGVQKSPVFCEYWSKLEILGSFVDKHHILHAIDVTFG